MVILNNGDKISATITTDVNYCESIFDIANKIIRLFREDIQK
jgi:hypothetical protein